jgi:hypothetical protein
MDWLKVFSKSVILTIAWTILFPIVQIGIGYLGILWFAPLPRSLLGKEYWGLPWGFVSRMVNASHPYVVEWNYLIYDLVFWFILSFIYYSFRFRKR